MTYPAPSPRSRPRRLAAVLGACLIAGGAAAVPAVPAATQTPDASAPAAAHEAAYRFVLAKMLASEGDFAAAGVAYEEALALAPDEPIVRLEYASHLIRLAGASRGTRRGALLEQARQEAERAAAAAGDEPALWRTLADVYYDLSRDEPALAERAREALEKVLAAEPDDLESALTLGQIYLGNGEPAKAAELFGRVAERTSGNRFVYSMLGESLMRTGRLAEAEEVLGRLLAIDPSSRQVRLGLAGLRSERGDHEAALRTMNEAPGGLRQQADVRRRIALELLFSGRPDEAREIVDELFAADPASPQVIGAYALVLAAQGEGGELDALIAEMEPTDTRRRELAALLQQHGEDAAAERMLRDTLAELEERRGDEAARTAAAVRFQLADVLGDRGDAAGAAAMVEPLTRRGDAGERRELTLAYVGLLKDAGRTEEALQRLRRLDPPAEQRPLVGAMTVEVLLRAGRDEEAERELARLAADGDEEAVLLAARAAQAQRRFDLSIPLLERLAAAAQPSPDALFLLGSAYERTGRLGEAEEVFERLLERVPTHHPALNYLGYMWADRGENLDRALELVRRAVAAEPEEGSYVDSLGWIHYQLGEHELALRYLQRAATLIPGEPEVQEHLGDVQSALGDPAAARLAYRRALDLAERGNAEMVAELTRKLELLGAQ